jgi:hypothetical protein
LNFDDGHIESLLIFCFFKTFLSRDIAVWEINKSRGKQFPRLKKRHSAANGGKSEKRITFLQTGAAMPKRQSLLMNPAYLQEMLYIFSPLS